MSERDLPQGWTWTTLEEVVDTQRKRVKPQDYPHLQFVGMDHVEAHTMRLLGTVPASEMRSSAEYFEPGDVMYGRLRPYLNKVFRADFEGLCSAEFIAFRRVPHLDSKYFQYFLNSWEFVSFASRLNTGDRPRVNLNQIADYPFPLPPLLEQHRIVAEIEKQLTRLDAGVAALRRAKANLRRYKAAVLKAACEGRLVPQDPADEPASVLLERILTERRARWEAEQVARGKDPKKLKYQEPVAPDMEGLPELPEGWVWSNMQTITIYGPQNGLYLPKSAYGSGIPILRIDDFQDGTSRSSEELQLVDAEPTDIQKYSLTEDDLVINRVNSPSHLGKCLVVSPRNLPSLFESNMMRLRLSEVIIPSFVEFYLRSGDGRRRLISNAKWAVNQASINQKDVGNTPVPLPPIAEQQRIVAEVERRLSVVEGLEASVEANLKRAERLRQAMLKRAFEGELVPQDPDDEPASVLLERIRAERERRGVEGNGKRKARRVREDDQDQGAAEQLRLL